MNIDKVLRALSDLTSSGQVKLHAGFIVGLPNDTITDIDNSYDFCINNQQMFRGWTFTPLGIYSYSDVDQESMLLSPIERDPQKYGYKITRYPGEHAVWENEHMTMSTALDISARLTTQSMNIMRCGGWQISSAWHNNESDYNIDTKPLVELNFDERGRQLVRERAIQTLKRYT